MASDEVSAEVAQRRIDYVRDHLQRLDAALADGLTGYLYESLFLDVDSSIDEDVLGQWDLTRLHLYGLYGWRVVGVVPRTHGVRLANQSIGTTFGRSWGGGVGGNVEGAYVLLQLEIAPDARERLTPRIEAILADQAARRFPA